MFSSEMWQHWHELQCQLSSWTFLNVLNPDSIHLFWSLQPPQPHDLRLQAPTGTIISIHISILFSEIAFSTEAGRLTGMSVHVSSIQGGISHTDDENLLQCVEKAYPLVGRLPRRALRLAKRAGSRCIMLGTKNNFSLLWRSVRLCQVRRYQPLAGFYPHRFNSDSSSSEKSRPFRRMAIMLVLRVQLIPKTRMISGPLWVSWTIY